MNAIGRAALLGVACAAGAVPLASADEDARSSRAASASASAFAREDADGRREHVEVAGDGSLSGEGTSASASTEDGRGRASARARVEHVDIFDGLVTARAVEVRATARDGRTRTSGSVAELTIDGERVGSPEERRSYPLAGYGALSVLHEERGSIAGLRAKLTRSYRGHPAGSVVTVAFASARARDAAPREREDTATAPRTGERERTRTQRDERRRRRDRETTRSRRDDREQRARSRAERRRAPDLDVLPTGRGYVFPVFGDDSSYSNDWGAPRQHTGTHEGTDVFAPTGTPVLAVTDGVLRDVGTRPIPGNRMWLETREGDAFFYGHLAAFAHDARDGRRVEAGDVIGFVGSTGDAERTPPHLHFEVHPNGGEAVNPYPFLRAWEQRRDVPQAAWLERYGDDPGSRPGALVVVEDFLERR